MFFQTLIFFFSIGFLVFAILFSNFNYSPKPLKNLPAPELKGSLAPKFIKGATTLLQDLVSGPESIVVEKDVLYTCLADARCVKIVDGKIEKTIYLSFFKDCDGSFKKAEYCGRPLGLRRKSETEFLVADAFYGIFKLNFEKEKSELIFSSENRVGGFRQKLLDDLDILDDNIIFYSDASIQFGLSESMICFLGNLQDGRLIQLNLNTSKTKILINGLSFPNGVQIHPDKQSVLVAESVTAKINRYYFAGPKKGRQETFNNNLPGFPDNIRLSANKKSFYVALFGLRPSIFDYIGPYPFIKKILGFIMEYLPEKILMIIFEITDDNYGIIVELDLNGNIIDSYHDPTGKIINSLSQVTDDGGKYLYLGSFVNKFIGRINKHIPNNSH